MSSPNVYSYSDVPASWSAPSEDSQVPVPTDKRLLVNCTITGLVGQAIGDLAEDPDKVPEVETLNGVGTITPGVDYVLAPHFVDSALSIKTKPVTFDVVDGR